MGTTGDLAVAVLLASKLMLLAPKGITCFYGQIYTDLWADLHRVSTELPDLQNALDL